MLASLRRRLADRRGRHARRRLDEFLDRQRTGLASTFLTRLRVGPDLVDARAVPALYSGRVRAWHLCAGAPRRAGRRGRRDRRHPGRPGVVSTTLRPALTDLLSSVQGLFS